MNKNFNLPPGCMADDIDRESCWWVRGTRPRLRTSAESVREFRRYLKNKIAHKPSDPFDLQEN
jgi:hypothetical protein